MLNPNHHRRAVTGSVMIEFVMILPLLLFLTLFALDMGRLVFIKATLSDAAYLAARSGAQYGDATVNDNAQKTFRSAMATDASADNYDLVVIQPRCTANSGRGAYIIVEGHRDVNLITPGLGSLLELAGGDGSPLEGPFSLSARAVALCQVRF